MYRKQTISKFLLITVMILVSLVLCICAVISSNKSAEAKTNESNDFSCVIETVPEYHLTGNYADTKGHDNTIDYTQDIHLFNYCELLDEQLKSFGMSYYIVPESSYYTISNDDPDGDTLLIYLQYYIDGIGEYPFDGYFAAMEFSEKITDARWLLNGKTFDYKYNEPIYMNNQDYHFTAAIKFENILISGNVVDQFGDAIDGAKVSLVPENVANAIVPEPVMTVNGIFAFEDVDPSILPATVNVEKDGYTFIPVRITENDVVDGKIMLTNLTLNKVTEEVTETAKTFDTNYYLVFALMTVVVLGFGIAYANRSKN